MGMKSIADNREPEFPPEGWEGNVMVTDARAGETRNGYPSFGLQLVVTSDGGDKEKSFWDNIYFSANGRANDQSLAKLQSAGLTKEFWNTDPEPDPDVTTALIGLKFGVRATWDENKDDASRPWLRCTYLPLQGEAAVANTPEDF